MDGWWRDEDQSSRTVWQSWLPMSRLRHMPMDSGGSPQTKHNDMHVRFSCFN